MAKYVGPLDPDTLARQPAPARAARERRACRPLALRACVWPWRAALLAPAGVGPRQRAAADAPDAQRRRCGPPRGRALSGAALDARTEEVAALLRCPVCQGLSVGGLAVHDGRRT